MTNSGDIPTPLIAVQNRLDEVILYLKPLTPIIDSHMVTFITQDIWNCLVPEDIKKEFESHWCPNIFNLFFSEGVHLQNENLKSFLSTAYSMGTRANRDGLIYSFLDLKDHFAKLGCQPTIGLSFNKFMCAKKTHEVEIMSDIIAAVCELTEVVNIIDVGDGKGYLSSILALENKFKVLGIDCSSQNSAGAAKRVEKMKKHWKAVRKKMDNVDGVKLDTDSVVYNQYTDKVDENTNLNNIVKISFKNDNPLELGIIGLHTCGSLTSTCIKLFVRNTNLKFIVNVGCCYHLIEPNDFPISNYLKSKAFTFSRNAKMLSLQPISRIVAAKTIKSDPLMYRAVFEHMMENVFQLGSSKADVGRISSKCSNFCEYVRMACARLNLHLTLSEIEIKRYYDQFLNFEPKLQFYFLLRSSIAPAIENVILLDRILYLLENGFNNTYLVDMFDPVISPRNYGIVSLRHENGS